MKIFNLIITTEEKYDIDLSEAFSRGCECAQDFIFKTNNNEIIPIIYSLKELRKNTWDKDRVDHMIDCLTRDFEVKNEKEN